MIVKTCKKHGDLTSEQIRFTKYKGKINKKCIQCERERSKRYYEPRREEKREKDRQYFAENKTAIAERRREPEKLAKRREWYHENKERYADYYREKQAKYKEALADPYVKKVIQNGDKNIKMKDIPQQLIELARVNILIKEKVNEARILQKIGKAPYGENTKLRTTKKSPIS